MQESFSFLFDGWEFYPDVFLSPEVFPDNKSASYSIRIGDYPNFAPFQENLSPYGFGTYRLTFPANGMQSLYLPEIMAASKVYINGVLVGNNGNVDKNSYLPFIKDCIYTFSSHDQNEIIIQTSNYSHYYSGLYYPPAIGKPESIQNMLFFRLLFYTFFCFSAFSLSLFCITFWFCKRKSQDSIMLYLGLLCASFCLWLSYPFALFVGFSQIRLFYAVQDALTMFCIFCTTQIANILFLRPSHIQWKRISSTISLGMCFISTIFPLFVLPAFPDFINLYGSFISFYKLLISLFLCFCAIYGCLKGASFSFLLLSAIFASSIFLFSSIILIGHFAPIHGAWLDEYSMFFMVIGFTTMAIKRNYKMQAENEYLSSHLKEEVANQTKHLNLLLAERGQLMAELGHDIKSPLTSLSNIAQLMAYEHFNATPEMKENLLKIDSQCSQISSRLQALQEFSPKLNSNTFSCIELREFLTSLYQTLKPVIELSGPDFLYESEILPCYIMGNKEKIQRALENLIFNSLDFTPSDGVIRLSLSSDNFYAYITVSDSGSGINEKNLPHVFEYFYTTRSNEGGQGLGLSITKHIVLEHNGTISVSSEAMQGTSFCIQLPLVN